MITYLGMKENCPEQLTHAIISNLSSKRLKNYDNTRNYCGQYGGQPVTSWLVGGSGAGILWEGGSRAKWRPNTNARSEETLAVCSTKFLYLAKQFRNRFKKNQYWIQKMFAVKFILKPKPCLMLKILIPKFVKSSLTFKIFKEKQRNFLLSGNRADKLRNKRKAHVEGHVRVQEGYNRGVGKYSKEEFSNYQH